MTRRSLSQFVSAAAFALAGIAFVCSVSVAVSVSAAGVDNGIEVITPGSSTLYHGLNSTDGYVLSLFINSPRHNATYSKNAVPLDYKLAFSVCNNRISYARVIGRVDQAGNKLSTFNGGDWKIVHDEKYAAGPSCSGSSYSQSGAQGTNVCVFIQNNTENKNLDLSFLSPGICSTTLQLTAFLGQDTNGGTGPDHWGPTWASFGVTPSMLFDESNVYFRKKSVHSVNLWLNFCANNPPTLPQCSDGIDNADPEDTLADFNDQGCYTNGIYNPNDNDETDAGSQTPQCRDGIDNADPEDTLADYNDPGCYDANGRYNPNDTDETDNGGGNTGCIEVRKITQNTVGQPITPVAQFTFRLDQNGTAKNDSNGIARFDNVSAGSHVILENVPYGWNLVSISPVGGLINVVPGAACAQVTFTNRQNSVVGYQNTNANVTAYNDGSGQQFGNSYTYQPQQNYGVQPQYTQPTTNWFTGTTAYNQNQYQTQNLYGNLPMYGYQTQNLYGTQNANTYYQPQQNYGWGSMTTTRFGRTSRRGW